MHGYRGFIFLLLLSLCQGCFLSVHTLLVVFRTCQYEHNRTMVYTSALVTVWKSFPISVILCGGHQVLPSRWYPPPYLAQTCGYTDLVQCGVQVMHTAIILWDYIVVKVGESLAQFPEGSYLVLFLQMLDAVNECRLLCAFSLSHVVLLRSLGLVVWIGLCLQLSLFQYAVLCLL